MQGGELLLSHFLVFRRLLYLLDVFQSADAFTNGGKVGECAAEPTLVHIELPARQGSLFYGFLCLFLATDEQNPAAASRDILKKRRCTLELPHRFIEVDDVNLIALFENEWLHLWIPTLRLVSKMNTSFQKFGH